MLLIYEDVLAMQSDARGLCDQIVRHDVNLAAQLRRAAQSVALNLSEGMAAWDGNRRKAYGTALREAKECKGAVAVAQRWGYVGENDAVIDRMDKIVATLVKLTKPRS